MKVLNCRSSITVLYQKNSPYNIIANFATLNNKVISLANSTPIAGGRIDNNYFATLTTVGQPVGEFYLLQQEGIFQTAEQVFTPCLPGPECAGRRCCL
jgi:hypothetical protein